MKLNFNLASTARITVKQISVNGKFQWKVSVGCASDFRAYAPRERLCENPNREVGDASVQPTREAARRPQIPQPRGWGFFTLTYRKRGVSDTCLGWSERSPTFPVGGLQGAADRLPVGGRECTPTFRLGDSLCYNRTSEFSKSFTRGGFLPLGGVIECPSSFNRCICVLIPPGNFSFKLPSSLITRQ